MRYTVEVSKNVAKQLQKMDVNISRMLSRWMRENLDNCQDPRRFGKQLLGDRGHLWRYRVDKYRLLAKINDDTIEILIVDVGHRDKVYK